MQEVAEQTSIEAVTAANAVAVVPPAQRAAVAMGADQIVTKVKEFVAKSATITSVIDKDGREQAHRAGMDLKELRVSIKKTGEEVRDDANKFAAAVIAKQTELIALVTPEETRVFALRDKYDAEEKAKKEAAAKAEASRIAEIEGHLADLRADVPWCVGKSADAIFSRITALQDMEMQQDTWQEYLARAIEVRADVVAKMTEAHQAQHAAEVEAARIKAEADAEAKRVAEQAEANRLAAIELQRQRDEMAAKQEADAARRAADQIAAQKLIDDALRIADEQIAAKRKELADAEAVLQAQRDVFSEQQRVQEAADAKRRADEQAEADAKAEAERVAAMPVAAVVAVLEGPAPADPIITLAELIPDTPEVAPAPVAAVPPVAALDLRRAVLALRAEDWSDAAIRLLVDDALEAAA
jgi:hypothetical protein